MFVFVSGAVRSGKSTWAEERAIRLAEGRDAALIYLATARVFDGEMQSRVALHRSRRREKGFTTLERPRGLSDIVPQIPAGATVLLECLGTWTANELFDDGGDMADFDATSGEILGVVRLLRARAGNLIVVSNDIFADGVRYEGKTESYRGLLGSLHAQLAPEADMAVECVAGIAAARKAKPGVIV